jgi:hypothetical protein
MIYEPYPHDEIVTYAVDYIDAVLEANLSARGTEVLGDAIDHLQDLITYSLLWLDVHAPDVNIDDHLDRARNQYIEQRLAKWRTRREHRQANRSSVLSMVASQSEPNEPSDHRGGVAVPRVFTRGRATSRGQRGTERYRAPSHAHIEAHRDVKGFL